MAEPVPADERAWARDCIRRGDAVWQVAQYAGRGPVELATAIGLEACGRRERQVVALYRAGHVRSEIMRKAGCSRAVVNAVIEREDNRARGAAA